MDLKEAHPSMGLEPLHLINSHLERLLGKDWFNYEVETISLELGIVMDDLLKDKISVLKVFHLEPGLYYKDLMFFLYSTECINNTVADFDHVPHLTSLELALGIDQAKKIQSGVFEPDSGIPQYINYILTEEGFSEPVWPFTEIPGLTFTPGQTEEDTNNKALAIKAYVLQEGK